MPLSHDQLLELTRIQKMIRGLEKIKKNSKNPDQLTRVTWDLEKYQRKMNELSPDGIPDNLEYATLTSKRVQAGNEEMKYIQKFPTLRITPNSNDREINQIGTLVKVMDEEFVPVLSDSHIKFDFSNANERDTILKHMENLRRNLKLLQETIEEYAAADKQEFKEQLSRMKNKQSRIFIAESYEVFKKFKDFLEKVHKEIREGNKVIMNMDEPIHFNKKFETATILEGKYIPEAIKEFLNFVKEVIELVNLPDVKV